MVAGVFSTYVHTYRGSVSVSLRQWDVEQVINT